MLRNQASILDLEAASRLPEIGVVSVESGVLEERHHTRVELLDDVVEVYFSGFLVVAWGFPMGKLRFGIFAQDLKLALDITNGDLFRKQVASKPIRPLALGIVRVVPAQPVVVGILAFDRKGATIGQFPFEEEIDA